jgi:hypothetical protein
LEYHIIKHLFDKGYREYHSGPGSNTYKLHWTERERKNIALHFCNDNLRGRIVQTVEVELLPRMRRVRDLKWSPA